MSFNTGNTVPSSSAKDLSDNAENFDDAVNAQTDTWHDRLGVTRDTVTGRLKKMGYTVPVAYTAGISFSVNDNVKTVDESGFVYAPLPSALPFTTSGTWGVVGVSGDNLKFFVVQGLTNDQLINDLSQVYEFKTVAEYEAFTVEFPIGKTIRLLDRGDLFSVISGVGSANTFNIIASQAVSQSISLQKNIDNSFSPKGFGLALDGVTDDTVAATTLISSGVKSFSWGAYTVALSSNLVIGEGHSHEFKGTKLLALGQNKLLVATDASNWSITGALTLEGATDGRNTATPNAASDLLTINGQCLGYIAENITCKNTDGTGFAFSGQSAVRDKSGRLSNCYSYNCARGWDLDGDEVGQSNGSEYLTITGSGATRCYQGARINTGNVTWTGGVIIDNEQGVFLDGTLFDNHLHGSMTGVHINHNSDYNLRALDCKKGFTLNGCHFYGDGVAPGSIDLENSQAVCFNGGILAATVNTITGAGTITGKNQMTNMLIANDNATVSGDRTRLEMRGMLGLGDKNVNFFNIPVIVNPSLENTWVNNAARRSAGYYYDQETGQLNLTGWAGSGALNSAIFTLPVGFRPDKLIQVVVPAGSAFGSLNIDTAGTVKLTVGDPSAVSLEGVSFSLFEI